MHSNTLCTPARIEVSCRGAENEGGRVRACSVRTGSIYPGMGKAKETTDGGCTRVHSRAIRATAPFVVRHDYLQYVQPRGGEVLAVSCRSEIRQYQRRPSGVKRTYAASGDAKEPEIGAHNRQREAPRQAPTITASVVAHCVTPVLRGNFPLCEHPSPFIARNSCFNQGPWTVDVLTE